MEAFLLLVSVAVIAYALVSTKLPKTIISAPMFFVTAGFAIAILRPSIGETKEQLEILAELTLVVLLFTDASRIDARKLMREVSFPLRLLGVGLPLTVILGAVLAKILFPEFSLAEAALVAAMLAPTDAALGQAVVSSPKVPIRIRQALNVESGLNDGIIVPVVLFFAALAAIPGPDSESLNWLLFWFQQITLGPLAGITVTWICIKALENAARKNLVSEQFMDISGIALAVLAWSVANAIGGNGFIAAFAGGMTVGCTAQRLRPSIQEFGETEGQLLSLLAFTLFGTLLPPVLSAATPAMWLYGLLSLTLIRMLPVAIAMIGTKARLPTLLFLGWFGPRGLASIIFVLLQTSENDFVHEDGIFQVTIITALLSVLAHGISAVPGAAWYGNKVNDDAQNTPEHKEVHEHETRL